MTAPTNASPPPVSIPELVRLSRHLESLSSLTLLLLLSVLVRAPDQRLGLDELARSVGQSPQAVQRVLTAPHTRHWVLINPTESGLICELNRVELRDFLLLFKTWLTPSHEIGPGPEANRA